MRKRNSTITNGQKPLLLDFEPDPFADEPLGDGSPAILPAPGSTAPAPAVPPPDEVPLTPAPTPDPPAAPDPPAVSDSASTPAPAGTPPAAPSLSDPEAVTATFGMTMREMLAPERLVREADPAAVFQSAEEVARRMTERRKARREPLRKMLRERLDAGENPPPHVGLHPVTAADLERVARSHLYNGLTEAVCGDAVMHETVPLTLGQLGVCVVGYDGRSDQWHQRIVRQELCLELDNPLAEAEAALHLRDSLQRPGGPNRLQEFSDLARRGIVSYREREMMLTECQGHWRMGFGMPAPLELLTGMGNMDLLDMGLDLLERLLLGDPRWLFVTDFSGEAGLEMLADALNELEFVVLMRLQSRLEVQVEKGKYGSRRQPRVDRFVAQVGPRMVLGAFRAGALAPPRLFVAHEDRVCTAALIAMADALATQPQGYPALIQLARSQCRVLLGGSAFQQVIQQAFRRAGAADFFHRGEIR